MSLVQTNETAVDLARLKLRLAGISLGLREARLLRGAIATGQVRSEFHNHRDDTLVYRHPLVRYDTSFGVPRIVGIGAGAMLTKTLQLPATIKLGQQQVEILDSSIESERVVIGPSKEPIQYLLGSPLLPLNQKNDRIWRKGNKDDRQNLLDRVLIGNVLSFCKTVGLHVSEKIVVKTNLAPAGAFVLKPGVRMRGFRGSFEINFHLPEFWGLGKSSSRGFGTIVRKRG